MAGTVCHENDDCQLAPAYYLQFSGTLRSIYLCWGSKYYIYMKLSFGRTKVPYLFPTEHWVEYTSHRCEPSASAFGFSRHVGEAVGFLCHRLKQSLEGRLSCFGLRSTILVVMRYTWLFFFRYIMDYVRWCWPHLHCDSPPRLDC